MQQNKEVMKAESTVLHNCHHDAQISSKLEFEATNIAATTCEAVFLEYVMCASVCAS